jgi:hypothetical protein
VARTVGKGAVVNTCNTLFLQCKQPSLAITGRVAIICLAKGLSADSTKTQRLWEVKLPVFDCQTMAFKTWLAFFRAQWVLFVLEIVPKNYPCKLIGPEPVKLKAADMLKSLTVLQKNNTHLAVCEDPINERKCPRYTLDFKIFSPVRSVSPSKSLEN